MPEGIHLAQWRDGGEPAPSICRPSTALLQLDLFCNESIFKEILLKRIKGKGGKISTKESNVDRTISGIHCLQ
jgi:hypothetical protein